jgi:deoxycytidine triphosphate deaminase
MSALRDVDITTLLDARPSLSDSILPGDERIKRASLDLTIGKIFLPETLPDKLGGINNPRLKTSLSQGQTALIETAESVNLPMNIVAVGFPPASVTINGLLMTNPGLVDPGYKGPLHCTVINMGKMACQLKAGDRIMRLVLYQLSGTAASTLHVVPAGINEETLDALCLDFLSIQKNIKSEVEGQIQRASWWTTIYVGAFALFLSVGGTVLTNYLQMGRSKDEVISALTTKVNELENDKLKQLQDYIDKISKSGTAGKGDR